MATVNILGEFSEAGKDNFAQRNYDMKRGHSYHQPAEKRENQDAVKIPPIIARNP